MYTRTKHVSHLASGKKLPQTGEEHARGPQPPPTALQAPSVARRHRRPHYPAGSPREEAAAAAAAVSPLASPSPGFVVVTAQAAGRILTGTGGEREERPREAGAAQRSSRSLAATPLLRSPGPPRAPPGDRKSVV